LKSRFPFIVPEGEMECPNPNSILFNNLCGEPVIATVDNDDNFKNGDQIYVTTDDDNAKFVGMGEGVVFPIAPSWYVITVRRTFTDKNGNKYERSFGGKRFASVRNRKFVVVLENNEGDVGYEVVNESLNDQSLIQNLSGVDVTVAVETINLTSDSKAQEKMRLSREPDTGGNLILEELLRHLEVTPIPLHTVTYNIRVLRLPCGENNFTRKLSYTRSSADTVNKGTFIIACTYVTKLGSAVYAIQDANGENIDLTGLGQGQIKPVTGKIVDRPGPKAQGALPA